MDEVLQEGRPQQDQTVSWPDCELRLDVRVTADRRHVGRAARIVKTDAARTYVLAAANGGWSVRYAHVVSPAEVGVRVIMRIMVVADAIDVGPAMQAPVDSVVGHRYA